MQSHVRPPNIEISETKYLKTVRAEVAQAQSKEGQSQPWLASNEIKGDEYAQARPQNRVQRASE